MYIFLCCHRIIWSSLEVNCITGPTYGFCSRPTQWELIQCLCLFLSHATFRRRHFLIRNTGLHPISEVNNCKLFHSEREFLDLQSSSMSHKTPEKTLKLWRKLCYYNMVSKTKPWWCSSLAPGHVRTTPTSHVLLVLLCNNENISFQRHCKDWIESWRLLCSYVTWNPLN